MHQIIQVYQIIQLIIIIINEVEAVDLEDVMAIEYVVIVIDVVVDEVVDEVVIEVKVVIDDHVIDTKPNGKCHSKYESRLTINNAPVQPNKFPYKPSPQLRDRTKSIINTTVTEPNPTTIAPNIDEPNQPLPSTTMQLNIPVYKSLNTFPPHQHNISIESSVLNPNDKPITIILDNKIYADADDY